MTADDRLSPDRSPSEGTDAGGSADDTPGAPPDDGRDDPSRRFPRTNGAGTDREGLLTRLRTAQSGPLLFVREVGTSVGAVAAVGLLLFAISGVWPPMVAVESGSMDPHMQKGDLVFITEPGRFAPDAAYGDTGVVTAREGAEVGYRTFGGYGSVIVYDNPERFGPPIIHRAHFWVDAGENWYDEANPDYVNADNCRELSNCPAPHAGFITKGDANARYDQASGISDPVRPAWVTGVARIRVPYLGWIRLGLSEATSAAVGSNVVIVGDVPERVPRSSGPWNLPFCTVPDSATVGAWTGSPVAAATPLSFSPGRAATPGASGWKTTVSAGIA